MRRFMRFLLSGLLLAGAAEPTVVQGQPAQNQPAQNQSAQGQPPQGQPAPNPQIYAVTYFSVAPSSVRKTDTLLRQFSAASRKEDGNAELTVLHEIGRPGHFALVEAWRDKAAYDAHAAAAKALGDKLQPLFASPFETRQFAPLAADAPAAGNFDGAIYVLTHVDVFPAGKDEVAGLIKGEAEDSRKDAGAVRYDAVVWDGHPNHFHLLEVWRDRKALTAHATAEHTRQFRAKVAPFEGAFYDERLYEAVPKSE